MRISLLAGVAFVLSGCVSFHVSSNKLQDEGETGTTSSAGSSANAQNKWPERAIRRDIRMLNMIQQAHKAGTRDSSGRPGSKYWQLKTDYTMSVRLDPATHTLTGNSRIDVFNGSPSALSEVYLRLDHNYFRGGMPTIPRGSSRPAELTDGMVIKQIRFRGQNLSLAGLNQTIARVGLPAPIASNTTESIEITWSTKLPGGPSGSGHRMTMRWGDTLYQPTQWFPRLAKYDDMRGWETDPYLGPPEFYNNFGRFDVRIDVPAGWLVSGTGVLQNPQEVLTPTARERLARALTTDEVVTVVDVNEVGPGRSTTTPASGDRHVWHFVADTVNDFVWATAKSFVWQSTRAMIPGKGAVPLHMFYLPGNAPLYTHAARITRHALEFYSQLLTPYAFPQLTIQDGPSSGMEYPMVINSNQDAADHETAHQWWPMLVGTNETRFAWMDEGFNMFVNTLSEAHAAGKQPNLRKMGQSYGNTSGNETEPPLMWNSNYAGSMYGFQAYYKTPLMFAMLGGIVGDSAVQRAISEYTTAWRFKHPSPWDFMFFMNRALGKDLGWFWNSWLFTTESVDGSIQSVTTQGTRTLVTIRQDGGMPSPVVLKMRFASTGPAIRPMPNSRMTDSVTAVVTYPVDVWFSGNRTYTAVLDFGGRVIDHLLLDPEQRFPDRNPDDNAWSRVSNAPSGK